MSRTTGSRDTTRSLFTFAWPRALWDRRRMDSICEIVDCLDFYGPYVPQSSILARKGETAGSQVIYDTSNLERLAPADPSIKVTGRHCWVNLYSIDDRALRYTPPAPTTTHTRETALFKRYRQMIIIFGDYQSIPRQHALMPLVVVGDTSTSGWTKIFIRLCRNQGKLNWLRGPTTVFATPGSPQIQNSHSPFTFKMLDVLDEAKSLRLNNEDMDSDYSKARSRLGAARKEWEKRLEEAHETLNTERKATKSRTAPVPFEETPYGRVVQTLRDIPKPPPNSDSKGPNFTCIYVKGDGYKALASMANGAIKDDRMIGCKFEEWLDRFENQVETELRETNAWSEVAHHHYQRSYGAAEQEMKSFLANELAKARTGYEKQLLVAVVAEGYLEAASELSKDNGKALQIPSALLLEPPWDKILVQWKQTQRNPLPQILFRFVIHPHLAVKILCQI
ncbi:hypothetical protein BOTBODRAFT_45525 [Botryobasidium botryosum FD-172 SS1]|uniref:Uncharacterized protein n=1 Tax=Botryobasidium botryosum (strain FD-172 SS1) TaxID=930990 RepID=A0A067MBF5_BOTB1|nr:hypothetical protein BOTBODRAFT_45525 [Botryobasidium botryosum FD-172 SS1]